MDPVKQSYFRSMHSFMRIEQQGRMVRATSAGTHPASSYRRHVNHFLPKNQPLPYLFVLDILL